MIKNCSKWVLAFSLLFTASAAYAEGWYFGLGLGTSSYDLPGDFSEIEGLTNEINSFPGIDASFEMEDSDTALKLFGGFDLNSRLGFQFGYVDLGEVSFDFSLASDGTSFPPGTTEVSTTLNVEGLSAGVIGNLALSDSISLNGQVGLYLWDGEGEFISQDTTGFFDNSSDSVSDDGSDAYYGIGMDIGWFSLFYEIYDVDGDDVDLAGIAAKFRFN